MEIILLIIGLIFYFVPAIVAFNREHNDAIAVFLLDLFLGWTFVGWVIALVWSVAGQSPAAEKRKIELQLEIMEKKAQLQTEILNKQAELQELEKNIEPQG